MESSYEELHHKRSNPQNHPSSQWGHSAAVDHALHHGSTEEQPVSVPYTCLSPGKLCITVFKARDIKGGKGMYKVMGKPSPYGVIKFGGNKVGGEIKTLIQRGAGSHPEWNQAFTFDVPRPDREYNELSISLYSKTALVKDYSLGQLRLDCYETIFDLIHPDNLVRILAREGFGSIRILNLGQHVWENGNRVPAMWYPVFVNGTQEGEILLAFDLIPMPPPEIMNSRGAIVTSRVAPASYNPNCTDKVSMVDNFIQVVPRGVIILQGPNSSKGLRNYLGTGSYPGTGNYPELGHYPGMGHYPGTGHYPGAGHYPGTGHYQGTGNYPETGRYAGMGHYPGTGNYQAMHHYPRKVAYPGIGSFLGMGTSRMDSSPGMGSWPGTGSGPIPRMDSTSWPGMGSVPIPGMDSTSWPGLGSGSIPGMGIWSGMSSWPSAGMDLWSGMGNLGQGTGNSPGLGLVGMGMAGMGLLGLGFN